MKKLSILISILLLLSQSAIAFHTAMIGGVRDGMMLGLQTTQHLRGEDIMGRFMLAGSTGSDTALTGANPFQLGLGIKMRIADDFWGSVGGIYYSDSSPYNSGTSLLGGSFSLIWEDTFDFDPLFFEVGIDAMSDHPHMVAFLGYRFSDDFSDVKN